MSDRPRFPAPLPLVLSVVGLVSTTLFVTVWLRVVRGAGLPQWAEAAGAVALAVGFLATGAAFVGRFLRWPVPGVVTTAGWTSLGLVFLAFAAVVVTEPLRWLFPGDPLVARGLLVGVPLLGLFGAATARHPRVVHVDVPVRGLDPALDGFTVAQLSDVHVGHTSRAFVQWVVEVVNAQDVDLVAITGDLVEGTVDEVGDDAAPLGGLRSRHGTYFVTGNHEYFAGVERWLAALRALGMRVLRNEAVTITHRGASFALLGVDDVFGRLAPGHGFDLASALAGAAPGLPRVLLSHQPVTVDAAADAGVEVQLSGHTHGGQLFPFHFLVRLQQPYLAGLVDHRGTQLYVHAGTGHWGPPLRVGARGEIAILHLRAPP